MNRHRRGFTMVEVLAVIVIMSLIMAIAAPRLGAARERGNVESAKIHVASTIATARAAAIRRGVPARFEREKNDVWVSVITAGGWQELSPRVRLDSLYRVALDATNNVVVFDQRGVAVGLGGTAKFVVAHSGLRDSVCVSRAGMIMSQECF